MNTHKNPMQSKWNEFCGFWETFYDMPYSPIVVLVAQIHIFVSLFFGHGPSDKHRILVFGKSNTLSDNIHFILLSEFRHIDVREWQTLLHFPKIRHFICNACRSLESIHSNLYLFRQHKRNLMHNN